MGFNHEDVDHDRFAGLIRQMASSLEIGDEPSATTAWLPPMMVELAFGACVPGCVLVLAHALGLEAQP